MMMVTEQKNVMDGRVLTLFGEVTDESVRPIVEKILEWNMQDDDRERDLKGYDRRTNPIKLFINSHGGSPYAGFSVIGAFQGSQTPIVTVCIGTAMSMAFAIFAAGDKRIAHEFSTFMYHEVATAMYWSKLTEIKAETAWLQTLMNMYDRVVLDRTKITKERLDDVKKSKSEWYLTADDALKHGLVDELF